MSKFDSWFRMNVNPKRKVAHNIRGKQLNDLLLTHAASVIIGLVVNLCLPFFLPPTGLYMTTEN